MRNILGLAIPVVAVMSLTACSGLDPYPTYPAVALAGEDPAPRVAICYNAIVSNLDQVQAAAQQECAPNTQATLFQTERSLQYCPLLLPGRATFLCTPSK